MSRMARFEKLVSGGFIKGQQLCDEDSWMRMNGPRSQPDVRYLIMHQRNMKKTVEHRAKISALGHVTQKVHRPYILGVNKCELYIVQTFFITTTDKPRGQSHMKDKHPTVTLVPRSWSSDSEYHQFIIYLTLLSYGVAYAARLALSAALNPACFPAIWLGVKL